MKWRVSTETLLCFFLIFIFLRKSTHFSVRLEGEFTSYSSFVFPTQMNIQNDRKVTQPIPDMFYLSKEYIYIYIHTHTHWNQKTKTNVILSVGNIHRVQWCMNPLLSSCLMQPGNLSIIASCVTETGYQKRYCRSVWRRRIGKCIPKLILAS
jgi:hypothetical protein